MKRAKSCHHHTTYVFSCLCSETKRELDVNKLTRKSDLYCNLCGMQKCWQNLNLHQSTAKWNDLYTPPHSSSTTNLNGGNWILRCGSKLLLLCSCQWSYDSKQCPVTMECLSCCTKNPSPLQKKDSIIIRAQEGQLLCCDENVVSFNEMWIRQAHPKLKMMQNWMDET
jgi:hypothetical protein